MKLYNLLFESISNKQIISALTDMLKNSSSYTKVELKNIAITQKYPSYQKLAEDFYQQNKSLFNRITKDATTFKHIGGGARGDAFDLGNQILKIEVETPWDTRFSSKDRAEKAATDLFQKSAPAKSESESPTSPQTTRDIKRPISENSSQDDESIASHVPMIYDHGSFKFGNSSFSWVIMEKFEIPTGHLVDSIDDLLNILTQKFHEGHSIQDVIAKKDFSAIEKEVIQNIGIDLELKSDWYEKLVEGMWKLYGKGIRDFHSGNVGIRRTGATHGWETNPQGQGYLVFFD